MNSSDRPPGDAADAGNARGGDRRQGDRRRVDRRTPPPPWRRPWAYVAYGVAGALAIILLLSLGNGEEEPPTVSSVGTTTATPTIESPPARDANAPVQDAYGAAGFEGLLAEGQAATGRRVRTVLYCEPIRSVGLRTGANVVVSASVAEIADAGGRVPAAECRWGSDLSAPELLLVIPPASAGRFASMPEVEQSFVRRREVPAEVEWIGRSEALSLRNVGVLRAIEPS